MKKIEKKELIEKIIPKYIADDGTEFTDEEECKHYERQIALEKFSVIETSSEAEGSPNFDGGECYESHNYIWYRPKNEQEIELLQAAYYDDGTVNFHNEMIGRWICVETDCADDFLWVTTLDDGIEYAREVLSRLGYNMTVSRKEQGTLEATSEALDKLAERLWKTFEDVPMNPETEEIETDFFGFMAGTHREEIWHWFDEIHSKGVAYLLYGDSADVREEETDA